MFHGPINWVAILGATGASWLVGAVYYTLLGRLWMAALGRSRDELRATGFQAVLPFILSFVAEGIMAFVLVGVLFHINVPTIRAGLISGFVLWLGFVGSTLLVNNAYARRSFRLTLIDSAHWLLVLLVQGAILGPFANG